MQVQVTGKITNKVRKWTSSNDRVATVNPSSGEITAVTSGAATVTFSIGDKFAFCSVYVKEKQTVIPPADVEVEGITLNAHSIELALNESYTLTADISPENATDQNVIWKSSDTSVATVDDGVVTAVGSGVALIYATAGNKIAVCTVNVEEDYSEQKLRFKTLNVQDYVVSGMVPNSRDEFSFAEEIYTDFGKPVYSVCTDIECRNDIPSKIASLKTGDNKFYILTAINGEPQVYRVTIRRLALFTVTFDTDGGTPINPITAEEGAVVTLPEAVKAGYVFNYWTLNGQALGKTLTVTENVELLARYVAIKYSLTLKSDGCDAELTGGGSYIRNERVTVTAERRLGYDFLGWYNGETKMSDDYSFSFGMPMLAVTLTAKYKVSDEVANLDFVSTADTFVIKGFKQDCENYDLVVPSYTTGIEQSAFSLTNQIIDNVYWYADKLPCEGQSIFTDTAIRNFYIDSGVKYFPSMTFALNNGIENLYYRGTMSEWCNMDFADDSATPLFASAHWYVDNELVTEITVPDDVTVIKRYAFWGSHVTSVTLHEGITEIGFSAFRDCRLLESISLPSTLTSLGAQAFLFDVKLSGQIVIPEGIKELNFGTFYGAMISSVVIPVGVKTIANNMFDSIDIGKYYLGEIYYGGTREQWEQISIGSTNSAINKAKIYYYSEQEPSLSADGTGYDGNYWRYVEGQIEEWVYNGVTVQVVKMIDGNQTGCERLHYNKNEQITVETEAYLGHEFLGWYNGEQLVSESESYSFTTEEHFVSLAAKYKVADEVANLDFVSTADTFVINGFKNLSDTAVLTVPEYTTDIKDDAFSSLGDQITIDQVNWNVNLPFNKGIGLFRDTLIRNFVMKKGVTGFPKWTFWDCYGIENLRYQGTIADWCDMQFGDALTYYCSPLAYSVNFYVDGEQVTEVIIPQNLTAINDFLFFGAAHITRVVLPDGLLKIGASAFSNCKRLQECDIPQSVTEIGRAAFAHTAISGQVVITNGVKTLENNIFDNGSVSSVVIPSSVTSIGAYVFRKAPLEAVYYCGTIEQWNAINISDTNVELNNAVVYCYSESEPSLNDDRTDYDGNYWHYVDGVVTVWRKEEI